MKKLFFSLVVAFAAQSAMANVQLEAQITPLNPGVGAQSKFVRIYKSGEVQVQFCDVATGACTNPTYITTLSWYAMNHIMTQTEFARSGAVLETKDDCTFPPTVYRSYTADNKSVVLEQGNYPCGSVFVNQTDAADYLTAVLRQYEAR